LQQTNLYHHNISPGKASFLSPPPTIPPKSSFLAALQQQQPVMVNCDPVNNSA